MIRSSRIAGAVFPAALLGIIAGCIGLGALDGEDPGSNNGMTPGGNGTDPGDDRADLRVTLRVSNLTPQPGELVVLTCTLVDRTSTDVTFNFRSTIGRLVVDAIAGTARFIVDESDAGAALTFTCTASDANGSGEPSNSLTIIVSPSPGD